MEVERAQLINDTKAGKENKFYHVNFLKRGGVRITERKQTKAIIEIVFINQKGVNIFVIHVKRSKYSS